MKRWPRPIAGILAVCSALALGTLLTQPASAAEDKSFSRQLLNASAEIMEHLQSKGYKNVAVLKFRVLKRPAKSPSDSVGTLNMFAANRLEVALTLANPNNKADQIGIVRNASAVAAEIPGASHTTADGRARLFADKYEIAWGDQKNVKPDAFLTGLIIVEENLTDMTVGILGFDQQSSNLELISKFNAEVTPSLMEEMSESFVLRGAFDGGSTKIARNDPVKPTTPQKSSEEVKEEIKKETIEAAKKVKAQEASFPLVDKASPIDFQVFYDGVPQSLDLQRSGGEALLAEPQPRQHVTFLLSRSAAAKGRLGVVIKVNGENTLFRQKLPAEQCMKWILEPDGKPIKITGFQLTDQSSERFLVLTPEESVSQLVNYGEDVGTISLVVFREETDEIPTDLPPLEELDTAEDLLALTRGAFPDKKPANLLALKAQLRQSDDPATRALIVPGQQENREIKRVTFKTFPEPVMTATIRYYKP